MLQRKIIAYHLMAIPSLLSAFAIASPSAPEVKDKAHFFKDETIRKVDKMAREIAKEFDRDVVVETVLAVPEDQKERVKAMTAEDRTRFFSNWCTDRAEVTVTRGVYILICKDPPHLALEITKESQSAFGKEGHDKMLNALLKAFHEKKFDEGILAAMEFARDRFAAAKKGTP